MITFVRLCQIGKHANDRIHFYFSQILDFQHKKQNEVHPYLKTNLNNNHLVFKLIKKIVIRNFLQQTLIFHNCDLHWTTFGFCFVNIITHLPREYQVIIEQFHDPVTRRRPNKPKMTTKRDETKPVVARHSLPVVCRSQVQHFDEKTVAIARTVNVFWSQVSAHSLSLLATTQTSVAELCFCQCLVKMLVIQPSRRWVKDGENIRRV